jgi:hypothetical protein
LFYIDCVTIIVLCKYVIYVHDVHDVQVK